MNLNVPVANKFLTAIGGLSFVVLILICTEMVMAWAGLGEATPIRIDPTFGFVPAENKSVTWRSEGFSRFKYNSHGMQEDEVPFEKKQGTMRVAFFGDSFTEAIQVPREKNLCSLTEDILNSGLKDSKFEVLNFGVSSYSLGLMYLRMKELAAKFHPDVFVLTYHVNEVMKVDPPPIPVEQMGIQYCHPYFNVLPGGSVLLDYTTQRNWMDTAGGRFFSLTEPFGRHCRTVNVLCGGMRQLVSFLSDGIYSLFGSKLPEPNYFIDEKPYAYTRSRWKNVHGLIAAIQDLSRQLGVKLVIVRLPSFRYNDNPEEARLLAQSMGALNIEYLDLDSDTRKWPDKKLASLFFDGAGHFNRRGHQYVAQRISAFLKPEKKI